VVVVEVHQTAQIRFSAQSLQLVVVEEAPALTLLALWVVLVAVVRLLVGRVQQALPIKASEVATQSLAEALAQVVVVVRD
jgi:hypothetical protein